ncbi:hypothetical protein MASR2M70_21150 [Bacillota bacterium]
MVKKSFKFYSKIVIALGFVMFLFQTAIIMDIMNVILPVIEQQKGWTRGEINTVAAIGPVLGTVLGVILASVILKIGPKKATIGSVLLISAATIGMGLANEIKMFAVSMAAVQILSGVLLISIPALMANWYHLKRGTVLGIITIGAPFSTAFFTPLASFLIRTIGYSGTFIGIAAAFVVVGIGLTIPVPEKPELVGLYQDGAAGPPPRSDKIRVEAKWTLKAIFSKKETWILTFSFGAVYIMMTAIMSNLIPRLMDQGIPIQTALLMLSAGSILGIPMSYAWGVLDDKISTPKTSAIFLLFYVVAAIAMIYVSADKMFFAIVATFCIGATTGGMPNLIPSSIIWVFGKDEYVNVHRWLGGIYNLCRSVAFILMGWTITRFGDYTNAYYLFIPLAIVSSLLLLSMKKSYDPANIVNSGVKPDASHETKAPELAAQEND